MAETTLLTLSQVAEQLQVSEKTVQRWLIAGGLKGSKLGRLWRIKQEDLNEFIERRSTVQPSD